MMHPWTGWACRALLVFSIGLLAACGGASEEDEAAAPGLSKRAAATKQAQAASFPQAQLLTSDVMFEWAQDVYYSLFPALWPYDKNFLSSFAGDITYRHYESTGNYLGFQGEDVYLYGPVSGWGLARVGNIEQYACSVNAGACTRAPDTGDSMFAVNDYKQTVARFRNATPGAGQALIGATLQADVPLERHLAYDPAGDRLFVATKDARVLVADAVSTSIQKLAAARMLTLPGFYSITGLFLDRANDRLYVLGQRSQDAALVAIDNASQRTGPITPDRQWSFDRSGGALTVDLTRRIAYLIRTSYDGLNWVGRIAAFDLAAASGVVTSPRIIDVGYGPTSLAIDAVRDRLYIAADNGSGPCCDYVKVIAGASTASGTVTPQTTALSMNITGISVEAATDRLIIKAYNGEYWFVEQASTMGGTLPAGAVLVKSHPDLGFGLLVTPRT